MKKYIYLFIIAFTIVGCSQDETNIKQEDKIITVSVKLNGEISSSESPITRTGTESQDLIGIAVYTWNGSYYSNRFAYGLFDNLNDVNINLKAGRKYKFICTLIKDAKNKLYNYTGSSSRTCYPFWGTLNGTYYKLNDPFTYNDTFSSSLSNDAVTTGYNTNNCCANIDRFYGELEDYSPTVDGVVNINLKRVSFGLQVKVTGITDGTVNVIVKHKDANVNFVYRTGLSSNFESTATMYSMYHVINAWRYADADYQEPLDVSMTWTRSVGVTENLGTKTVNVKRNSMNIIHVKLTANGDGAAVGVSEENTAMGNESDSFGN